MSLIQFQFQAPSGNQAIITLTTIGNRTHGTFEWRDDPTDSDIEAAHAAADARVEQLTGLPSEAVEGSGAVYQEMDELLAERRKFLGGGQG